MSDVIVQQVRDWQIATAPGVSGWFMSWAKMGRIQGTNPINEPGAVVYFNYGRTRDEAIARIKTELGLQ